MKKSREILIEKTMTGYDTMAKDFSGTRMNFWPELIQIFEKYRPLSGKLLDFGCGNARFFREISHTSLEYYGIDGSSGLINEAKKYHPSLKLDVSDIRKTPYQNNFFDFAVSFAVVHHLPGIRNQLDFFKELYRVLKPGKVAIVTVWDIRKTRKKKIIKDYIKYRPKNFDWEYGDTLMDFTQHKESRFVHGFTKWRLKKISGQAGFKILEIKNIKRSSKKGNEENIVLVIKK